MPEEGEHYTDGSSLTLLTDPSLFVLAGADYNILEDNRGSEALFILITVVVHPRSSILSHRILTAYRS